MRSEISEIFHSFFRSVLAFQVIEYRENVLDVVIGSWLQDFHFIPVRIFHARKSE